MKSFTSWYMLSYKLIYMLWLKNGWYARHCPIQPGYSSILKRVGYSPSTQTGHAFNKTISFPQSIKHYTPSFEFRHTFITQHSLVRTWIITGTQLVHSDRQSLMIVPTRGMLIHKEFLWEEIYKSLLASTCDFPCLALLCKGHWHVFLTRLKVKCFMYRNRCWRCVFFHRSWWIIVAITPMTAVRVTVARTVLAGLHPFQSLQKQYMVFLSYGLFGSSLRPGLQYPCRWMVGIFCRCSECCRSVMRHSRVM